MSIRSSIVRIALPLFFTGELAVGGFLLVNSPHIEKKSAPRVAVPNLVGVPTSTASDRLKALHFHVRLRTIYEKYTVAPWPKLVSSQVPVGGTKVQRGSTVTILYYP